MRFAVSTLFRHCALVAALSALFTCIAAAAAPPDTIVRVQPDAVAGEYIVALKNISPDLVDGVAMDLALHHHGAIIETWHSAILGFWISMSASDAAALARDPRVDRVEQNMRVYDSGQQFTGLKNPPAGETFPSQIVIDGVPSGTYPFQDDDPNSPDRHPLWHLTRISHRTRNFPTITSGPDHYYEYTYCSTGQYVTAYIVDTGVLRLHQEFLGVDRSPSPARNDPADAPNILEVAGSNHVVSDTYPDHLPSSLTNQRCTPPLSSTPYFGHSWFQNDPWFIDVKTLENPVTGMSHGTAVASLLGGRSVGVAKNVTIVPVKVIGCQFNATNAYLISAFNWIKDTETAYQTTYHHRRPALISMSAYRSVRKSSSGTAITAQTGELSMVETAAKAVMDYGIPMIVSANNQASSACSTTPARLSRRGGLGRAITVGGLSKRSDNIWVSSVTGEEPGSNFGTCVDIFAPAEDIVVAYTQSWSAYRTSVASGTSFSAPIVAGIVARLMSEDPTLTQALDTNPAAVVDAVWTRLRDTATVVDYGTNHPTVADYGKLGDNSPPLIAYASPVPIEIKAVRGTTVAESPNLNLGTGDSGSLQLTVLAAYLNPQYQWYERTGSDGETLISGQTGPNFNISASAVGTEKKYFARVTAYCDASKSYVWGDSAVATVRVGGLFITQQSQSWWQASGQPVPALSVGYTAAPGVTPAIEWYYGTRGDTSHSAGTGATIAVTPTFRQEKTGNALEPVFWARLTVGSNTYDSDPVQYHFCDDAPVIHDASADGFAPGTAPNLTFTVSGSDPIRYRWFRKRGTDWDPLGNANEVPSAATVNRTVTIAAPMLQETTTFRVDVENECGSATREVTATANGCPPVPAFARPIIIAPVFTTGSCIIDSGQKVILEAPDVGPNASYAWTRTDTSHPSVALDTKQRIFDYPTQSAVYKVTVTTTGACAGTSTGEVEVFVRPSVTSQTPNMTVSYGGGINLSAEVEDLPNKTAVVYQWYNLKGAVEERTGAMSKTLALTNLTTSSGYFVRIGYSQKLTVNGNVVDLPTPVDSAPFIISVTSNPASCVFKSLDLWNPQTGLYDPNVSVNVPQGRLLALSARALTSDNRRLTRSDYFTWTFEDGHTENFFKTKYSAGDDQTHVVKVRFDAGNGCNSGSADNHKYTITNVPASCALVQSFPPPAQTVAANTAVRLTVVPADNTTNLTYEWRRSVLSDENQGDPTLALPAFSNESSVLIAPGSGTVWVRVRGKCPGNSSLDVVEDSGPILVYCDGCGRRRAGFVKVNNQSSQFTVPVIAEGASVDLVAPDMPANTIYEWWRGPYDDDSGPSWKTGPAQHDTPAVTTTYWVRMTDPVTGARTYSYPVTVYVISAPTSTVDVSVDPAQTVQYGSIVRLTCNTHGVAYKWHRGTYANTDVLWTDATLAIPALEDETYWVEVQQTENSEWIKSDLIQIMTTCQGYQPLLGIIPQPQDGHIAKYQFAWLSAFGMGKSLAYEWYDNDLDTRIAAWGPAYITSPAHDTTYWVRATDACGNTATASTRIRVCIPTITSQPIPSIEIAPGATARLEVTATPAQDDQNVAYQWYHGTPGGAQSLIPGATLAHYDVPHSDPGWYFVQVTGPCDDGPQGVTSRPSYVAACTPPTLVNATTRTEASLNDHISLVVNVMGTNMTFAWYNGESGDVSSPIAGAVSMALSFNVTGDGKYWARVTTDGICSIDSPTMVVAMRPVITAPPTAADSDVMAGATTTLSVSASGTGLTYAWYRGTGTDNQIGNAATITTPPITADTQFWARITSANGTFTNTDPIWVHVCGGSVTWTSTARAIATGEAYTLSISASPGPADGAQVYWYKGNSGDLAGSTLLAGPTGSTNYTFSGSATANYWVRVTNAACHADSTTVTIPVNVPAITTQPSGATIVSGANATLTVAASGTGLTYQWYIGQTGDTSSPIAGGTTPSIDVRPAVTTSYWARVTASGGVANSNAATMTVTPCYPAAITQVWGASVMRGQSATIGVTASGSQLTYAWYAGTRGNTATLVGTTPTLALTPLNTATYWVRVTALCGAAVDSAEVTVHVCMTPTIDVQPASQSVFSGSATTLTVAASETANEPLHYQWSTGGVVVGSDSPTFTTPALTSDTTYSLHISAGICSVDSNPATVSICAFPHSITVSNDQQTTVGQTVRLTLALTPSDNTYNWYKGAVNDRSQPVSGPSTVNYIDVAPTVTTSYWADVTHGSCTSQTTAMTVSVCVPQMTTQPQSTMINGGQSATLTVAANTAGVTYQWYTGTSGDTASPISGATSSSLTVSPTTTTSYWARATSSCGRTVNSNAATVSICQPPAITSQSASLWIARGQTTPLAVNATGNNPTYQWYTGASGVTTAPISGATAASLSVSPLNTTSYWVKVTACGTSVNGATITVSVCGTPTITTQPQSQSIFSGGTATLSVSATAATTAPLSYQWYRGSANDTSAPVGTNAPSFTTPALTTATNYWVRVSNGTGCTPADSTVATVSMCPFPPSVNGPADVQTSPGQTTRLQLSLGSFTYTWYQGNSGDTSVPIKGPSAVDYVDVAPTATTHYWVRIQSGTCVTNSTTTTVNVCVPQFTTQPANVTIPPGSSTTLTSAANTAGVTYQWYVGNSGTTTSPISGATGASLTITPSATTSYWVRATSSCARTVDSSTATVTLCAAPAISTQPQNPPSLPRNTAWSISVSASGTGIHYQWYNGQRGDTTYAVPGGTNATLGFTTYSSEYYWVRITGTCGTIDSNAALVSVYPVILSQPTNEQVSYGGSASLGLNVSGNLLHYQWYMNDFAYPVGTDSPNFNTPAIYGDTTFFCVITSGTATKRTDDINVTVN